MVGGSGPMAAFVELLHVPVVTAGLGEPGNRAHAPNENISLDGFIQGYDTQHGLSADLPMYNEIAGQTR